MTESGLCASECRPTNERLLTLQMATLKKRSDFLRTAKGMHVKSGAFVLQTIKNTEDSGLDMHGKQESQFRIGYTVTNRMGSAPVRNRIRRRLRAAWKKASPDAAVAGHDYVLIGKRKALNISFDSLVSDLTTALSRISDGYDEKRIDSRKAC